MLQYFQFWKPEYTKGDNYENILLYGKPPWLILCAYDDNKTAEPTFHDPLPWNYYVRCEFISSDNPCTKAAYVLRELYRNSGWAGNQPIVVTYQSWIDNRETSIKDFDALLKMYDRRIYEQTQDLFNKLDFNQVKQEQQDQFFRGLRLAKTLPMVALQICMDAYNFDEFEFNYLNPNSYFDMIGKIVGLAKSII